MQYDFSLISVIKNDLIIQLFIQLCNCPGNGAKLTGMDIGESNFLIHNIA